MDNDDRDKAVAYGLQTGVSGRIAPKMDIGRLLEKLDYRNLSEEAVEMIGAALTQGVAGANVVRNITKVLLQTRTISEPGRRKVRVNGVGKQVDRECLSQAWKSVFELEFTQSGVASCHDLPRANRDLELIRLSQLAYTKERLPVKLIGERVQALRSTFGALNVIGLASPSMDVRDNATRNTGRNPAVLKALRSRGVLGDAEANVYGKEFLTDRMAQDDNRKADILVARQVYFDRGPLDLADAMNSAAADRAFGSIIFPEGIISDPRVSVGVPHTSALLNCTFRVHRDARSKSGYVIQFSMGDFSNGYTHDLQSYLAMGTNCRIDTPHGSFSYTVVERYGDIIIYMMSRIPAELGQLPVRERFELGTGPKYKRITTWRYESGLNPKDKSSYRRVVIDVPADDWNRLGSKLLDANTGDSGKIQEAVRYLVQIQKSFTLFGKETRQGSKTSAFDLFPLAAAAVIRAGYLREVHGRVVDRARRDIQVQRSLSGKSMLSLPFIGTWYAVAAGARKASKLVVSIGQAFGVQGLLDSWFDLWFSNPNLEPSVEDLDVLRSLDDLSSDSLGYLVRLDSVYYSTRKYDLPVEPKFNFLIDIPELPSEEGVREMIEASDPPEDKTRVINNCVGEAKTYVDVQCRDVEAATHTKLLGMARLDGQGRKDLILSTWDEARNKLDKIVVFDVLGKRIRATTPRGITAKAMYVVPINKGGKFETWYEFSESIASGTETKLPDGEYMTWAALETCVSFKLRAQITRIPKFKSTDVRISLVEGVPGAGKTRQLVETLEPGTGILTASKVNRAEIAGKVKEARKERNVDIDPDLVRTFDSFIVNPTAVGRKLIFDEGFLRHPGFWFISLWLADTSQDTALQGDLTVYGDRVQISWNARNIMETIYAKFPETMYDGFKFLNRSYRCPADSLARIKNDYGGQPVYTHSAVRRSTGQLIIKSVEDVPILKGVVYLCFTQNERNTLAAFARREGFSVNLKDVTHESECDISVYTPETFQGQTRDRIIVVRSQAHTAIAYRPNEQRLVADSRHTHELVYIHVDAPDDAFRDQLVSFKTDEQLNVFIREKPGGGYSHTPGECDCGFNSKNSLFKLTAATIIKPV